MEVSIASIVGGTRQEMLEMPWEAYRAFPALNGSVIVKGRKSLLHLKHAWDDGGEDTDALRFGRLLHCLLFEPQLVESRYRAWDGTRRGKEYDAFCEDASLAGAEVVRQSGEYSLDAACEAAQGFLRNARVQSLIAAGKAEQTLLAPERGLQCKGRVDWISTAAHVLVDIKTANEIEERLFGAAFFRYGYDIKLGLYQRWLNRITGDHWPVTVIVLESKPPYDVATVPIPQPVLDNGVDKALEIIGRTRGAIEADCWPGVAGDGECVLDVPYYEMEEHERNVRFDDE